jgi:hypothetical protein
LPGVHVVDQEHDRLRREERGEKGNPIPNVENSIKRSIVPEEEPACPKIDGESSPSPSNNDPVDHLIAFRGTRSSRVSAEYGDFVPFGSPAPGLFEEVDLGSACLWMTNASPIQGEDLDRRGLTHHDARFSKMACASHHRRSSANLHDRRQSGEQADQSVDRNRIVDPGARVDRRRVESS